MNNAKDVNINEINEEVLRYKINEMDKAAFMGLLVRVAQKCFVGCVKTVDSSSLTTKEKECLNICFNSRSQIREKLLESIFQDININ